MTSEPLQLFCVLIFHNLYAERSVHQQGETHCQLLVTGGSGGGTKPGPETQAYVVTLGFFFLKKVV